MTTSGPRPDLEPASPSGAVAGTYQSRDNIPAEVRMTDGTFRHCEITGLARHVDHAWRVRLLWYGVDAQGHQSQMETWYLHDRAKFREPLDPQE